MPGILTTIREQFAEFLRSHEDSGAKDYFSDQPKRIEVFTEKLKSFEQSITDALTATGVAVIIATVTAKDAKVEPGKIRFGKVSLVARCYESPDTNDTDVSASDIAEAIAEFAKSFRVFGSPLAFQSITLGNDRVRLCYDVIFSANVAAPATAVRRAFNLISP